MFVRRVTDSGGFAMPAVMGGMLLVSIFVGFALAAAMGDTQLTRNDLAHRQAYEAAQAGIADYAYHLNNDTNYWSRCAAVPGPNALNQQGSRDNRRPVPGNTGAEYAIELMAANGNSACSLTNPVNSMIEQGPGPGLGTFRIRSTGFADDVERSIVATFKRASFLDYVYFTQLETSDPVTYGNPTAIAGAYQQCTKTFEQGRNNANIPGTSQKCDVISFINGERINGPMHTNDAIVVCGSPIFGRTSADAIEVSAPDPGVFWGSNYNGCSGDPNFVGTWTTNAPVLTPPPTNAELESSAEPQFKRTGQVRICLNGGTMSMANGSSCTTPAPTGGWTYSGPIPQNGLIYIENGACSSGYSPFTATYPTTSGCGNVYVRGSYSGQLTIAAENDIIIDGSITRSGSGMLGLIANNFVRVFHNYPSQTAKGDCNSSTGEQRLPNLRIDAAILAIQHSFTVDHYDCGSSMGTLTVNGAISQKFRGAVGTFSSWGGTSSGYSKNYNYDDRLRYLSPPHFLDPVQSAWNVQRQTLDFED